jgi:anti-sigma factor RsiW
MDNHLPEEILNEYLDHALDDESRRRAGAHLAACDDCRRRLAELQGVASLLAGLPEAALRRDLAPSVLAKLPRSKGNLAWELVLAGQAGVVLGALASILAFLMQSLQPQEWPARIAARIATIALPHPLVPNPFSLFPDLSLPTSGLRLTSANILLLAIAALLLWGAGNAILLRGRPEARK